MPEFVLPVYQNMLGWEEVAMQVALGDTQKNWKETPMIHEIYPDFHLPPVPLYWLFEKQWAERMLERVAWRVV